MGIFTVVKTECFNDLIQNYVSIQFKAFGKQNMDEAEQNSPDNPYPVFNRADALSRLLNKEELLQRVITVFLNETPKLLEDLNGYWATKDLKGIERMGHSIKGSASNIGAEALSHAGLQIEEASRAEDLALIEKHIPELEKQLKVLIEVLAQES